MAEGLSRRVKLALPHNHPPELNDTVHAIEQFAAHLPFAAVGFEAVRGTNQNLPAATQTGVLFNKFSINLEGFRFDSAALSNVVIPRGKSGLYFFEAGLYFGASHAGTANGIVAEGTFVGASLAVTGGAAAVNITNTLAFTPVAGRRYRIVYLSRATQPASSNPIQILLYDNAVFFADRYVISVANYQEFYTEWIITGDGAAHSYQVKVATGANTTIFNDSNGLFYIEDLGDGHGSISDLNVSISNVTKNIGIGLAPYAVADRAYASGMAMVNDGDKLKVTVSNLSAANAATLVAYAGDVNNSVLPYFRGYRLAYLS